MNKEILEQANRAAPELMQKTAQVLALIEKMEPEFVPDVLQEFEMISEVTTEKVASLPDAVKSRAIGVAASVGVGIAASLGTAIATDLYDTAKRGLTRARNFKRIMSFDPSLKDVAPSGKKTLKTTFDMVHRYAPDFTADPVLGSSLLRSLVVVPVGGEQAAIEKLIGSRNNLTSVRNNQFKVDLRDAFKGDKDHKQKMELEGAKQAPIHYHQHFEGKGPKNKPLSLRNPGSTPTNDP